MRDQKEGRRGLECHFALFRNRPQFEQVLSLLWKALSMPKALIQPHYPA